MAFKYGTIDNVQYWGYFDDDDTRDRVVEDLRVSLGKAEDIKHQDTKAGKFVVAFKLNEMLYVSKKGFYAMTVGEGGVWLAKNHLSSRRYTQGDVLILSSENVDDIPKFTDPESFCKIMRSQPIPSFCIPL